MSNYIVSARKYRPLTFDTVVGQGTLTTTLKNSIASGRLAHAYLFCGPRGVGKTTCARIFAKTINCLNPQPNGEACEQCESCRAFNEQRSFNIHELDAASNNSVDDIRELIEQVQVPPQIGKYKVFIVDEVHMLSTQAFNAFLKTLEEPPKHAIFILATTEKHKLLPTILSRCQIYDFGRITVNDIINHLRGVADKEGITYEPQALALIAQKADGGMRDALSIFDQVAAYCNGNITYQQAIEDLNELDQTYYFRITDQLLQNKVTDVILTLNDILAKGFQANNIVTGLNSHFRNLLMSKDPATTKLIETADEVRQQYAQQAARCTPKWLYAAIRKCTNCDLNYKLSQNKRLLVELTLIEIAQQADQDADPSGPGPKQLKPIFTKAAEASAPAAKPVPNTTATATPNTATATAPTRTATAPSATPTAATATHAAPNISATRPAPPAGGSRYGGFSLKQARQSASAQQPTAASPAQPTTANPATQAAAPTSAAPAKPLDQTTLTVAWRTMLTTLPKEKRALAAQLAENIPTLTHDPATSAPTLQLTAANEIALRELQQQAGYLSQALSTQLAGAVIPINVALSNEQSPNRPQILTPRQQLKAMENDNPTLSHLRELLGLEMD